MWSSYETCRGNATQDKRSGRRTAWATFDDFEKRNRTGHLSGGAPPKTGWADGGAHWRIKDHSPRTMSREPPDKHPGRLLFVRLRQPVKFALLSVPFEDGVAIAIHAGPSDDGVVLAFLERAELMIRPYCIYESDLGLSVARLVEDQDEATFLATALLIGTDQGDLLHGRAVETPVHGEGHFGRPHRIDATFVDEQLLRNEVLAKLGRLAPVLSNLVRRNAANLRREGMEFGDDPPCCGLQIALCRHKLLLSRRRGDGCKGAADDNDPSHHKTKHAAGDR